ncbi:esterase [Fistulifera solaris]|uniref:RNA exonuclease 4 n=1 Tax=Fistulifera solaris TaxID=1519565 RepID=A0A1Z5JTQ5_FISSO|nr:esterase [Fistulifera solaris]|eukprot:GAX17256.1 esterase [Fistulifera solaris]
MAFFTKKQKQLMRGRRRKKQKLGDQQNASESTSHDEQREEEAVSKKRLLQESSTQEDDLKSLKRPRLHEGSNVIVIPAELKTAQEKKKFRKECRRKAKNAGEDPNKLEFRDPNEDTITGSQQSDNRAKNKSKKKPFPILNELVKLEKLEKEKQAQREKRETLEASLSEEYKQKYVALDCEMVGIGDSGKTSVLARVSLVDWYGKVVLDTFVKVPTRVTDFRTWVSGVQPKHLKTDAMEVERCRETVAKLIQNKVVVGHALKNDFKALMLVHSDVRDTSKYRPFQRYGGNKWRPRKLRDLVRENLELPDFQADSHDSVTDATATMELFKLVRAEWERELELKKLQRAKKK